MNFEKEFPSLFGLWQPKSQYSDEGESLKCISGEFILEDIQKHCLDKKRVKEVIDKLKYLIGGTSTTEVVNVRILKKELRLE